MVWSVVCGVGSGCVIVLILRPCQADRGDKYHCRDPADCNNGASQYLLYGGIALLVLNVVTLVGGCARQLAMKVDQSGSYQYLIFLLLTRTGRSRHQRTVDCVCWVY